MLSRWTLGLCTALIAGAALGEAPSRPGVAHRPFAASPKDAPAAIAELPASALRPSAALRSRYVELLQESADRAKPDLATVVPDLVAFYRELSPRSDVPFAEIDRMRNGLSARLEHLRYRLNVEKRRLEGDAKRAARTGPQTRPGPESDAPTLTGGSLTAASAQQLIDLITNTIAPESWDINGGKGRIMFYSPLNVLVIRATGEVHEQVGGTLGGLRR